MVDPGRVDVHPAVPGKGLRDRDVVVWVPPGYDDGHRHPVLYAHDGQNLFDARTSYLGISWRLGETAAALVDGGRIEPIVIVGISNTEDRMDEYADTDRGHAYLDWIAGELKPRVDAGYRTRPDRTSLMGSSMGGLISFLGVRDRPDVFTSAACLSPVFPDTVVDESDRRDWPLPSRLYLDNGGDPLDRSLQPGIDRMLELLRSRGMQDDLAWYRDLDAPHNETAWADRVWRALMFLYGTGRPSSTAGAAGTNSRPSSGS